MASLKSLLICGAVSMWSSLAWSSDACRTRDDCPAGYKCLWNMCVAPKGGLEKEKSTDLWARPGSPRESSVRSFIGLTLAGGLLNGGYTSSEGTTWGKGVDAAFLFALRAGLLLGNTELAIEIAPFTDFWDLQRAPGPAFEANATVGYLVPLKQTESASFSWPFRIGVGFLAGGDNTGDDVFFEARLDAIGLAYRTGPLLVDFHVLSFRYAVTNGHVPGLTFEGVTTHYLSFFFGSSVSYLF